MDKFPALKNSEIEALAKSFGIKNSKKENTIEHLNIIKNYIFKKEIPELFSRDYLPTLFEKK